MAQQSKKQPKCRINGIEVYGYTYDWLFPIRTKGYYNKQFMYENEKKIQEKKIK